MIRVESIGTMIFCPVNESFVSKHKIFFGDGARFGRGQISKILHGSPIPVSVNLFEALRHLGNGQVSFSGGVTLVENIPRCHSLVSLNSVLVVLHIKSLVNLIETLRKGELCLLNVFRMLLLKVLNGGLPVANRLVSKEQELVLPFADFSSADHTIVDELRVSNILFVASVTLE